MFDDEGLGGLRRRFPDHPAVRHYDALVKLASADNRMAWPNEFDAMAAVCTLGLDYSTWAPRAPYDDFWSFLDAETRAWTLGQLRSPDQFEDAMAELFTWGWLRSEGFNARRVNEEGQSDVVVEDGGHRCEVKQIHIGTADTRVARVLGRANRQIKRTDPESVGTLFLSIARTATRAAFDDRVPNDVEPHLAALRDALKVHYRSVAQVVVMWDDVMILGSPPDPVLYAFRRRSVVVEHPTPRANTSIPPHALNVGRTATSWVRWTRARPAAEAAEAPIRPFVAGDIEVTELFRRESEVADGIRARHAIEAFCEPDARAQFDIHGIEVFLATRRIKLGTTPYTLLLLGSRRAEQGAIQLALGFRLYDDQAGTVDLWLDPMAAFETLIERYGLTIRAGPQSARFIPAIRLNTDNVLVGEGEAESFVISAFVRPLEHDVVEYSWVFAIDTTAYRAAAREGHS